MSDLVGNPVDIAYIIMRCVYVFRSGLGYGGGGGGGGGGNQGMSSSKLVLLCNNL